MNEQKKRACLDYLKAIASILVVVHHALNYANLHNTNIVIQALYTLVTCLHVPMFLFIAGYLCHKQAPVPFFRKKAIRILIPFVTFSLLKIAYSAVIDSSHAHGSDILSQLADAFLTGRQYWFIYAISIMYAISPLLWRMKRGNIVLFIALISVGTILEITGIHLGQVLQLHHTVIYACYFVGGFVFQQQEKKLVALIRKHKEMILTGCLVVIAGVLCYHLNSDRPMPHFLKVLLAFTQMYLAFSVTKRLPSNISLLKYIGKHSLQVMLFDSFFKIILFILIPVNLVTVWVIIALNVLLTCICCFIIEKIPYVKTLFGL